MIWLFLSFMLSFYTALPCCFISEPFATLGNDLSRPGAVAFSPVANCLAVANYTNNTVTIYSSSTCDGYSSASLVATITDGISQPTSLAFSQDGKCLAVANFSGGTSGNGTTTLYSNSQANCAGYQGATVQATIINQISGPSGVAFSQDGTCLAVGNFGSNKVTIYKNSGGGCAGFQGATVNATITNKISGPSGVAFIGTKEGSCLAVANSNNTITFYSNTTSLPNCSGYDGAMATATISDQISQPFAISFSPDGSCLAVANFTGASGNGSVTLYNNSMASNNCTDWNNSSANAIITNGILGADGVSFSSDGSCLAVANYINNTVTLYPKTSQGTCGFTNASTPCATIGNVLSPYAVSLSADGSCLAVVNPGANNVLVYNAETPCGFTDSSSLVATIGGLSNPDGVSLSADGSCLAVANFGANNVLVYNAATPCGFTNASMPTATIGGLSTPYGVSLSADGSCLAVANNGANNVLVYSSLTGCGFTDSSSPVATISSGISFPQGVSLSNDGRCLAVGNTGDGNVLVYSSPTACAFTNNPNLVATISGLQGPGAVALSNDGSCLAVANNGANNVLIYNSTTPCGSGYNPTLVTTIGGLSNPFGVSLSANGSCLAVANNTANTVTFYTKLNPVITGPNLVCQGSSASLFADVSPFQDNTNPTYLTYQWLLNGAVISGATGNTLTTDATLAPATYVYTVQVSDPGGCGPVTSAAFNVVVDGVIGTAGSFNTCSGVALQGTVSATSSSGSAITTYNFSQPGHGQLASLTSSDGSFKYTSTNGYGGSDSFTFTATDANGCISAPVTVTISVDSVVGTPASFSTCSGVALQGTVSATSSSGSAIATYNFSQPGHGQLGSLTSSDGSFVYTPNTGYIGSDSFTFTATDSNECTSAPVTVTINVDNAAVVLSSLGVLPNVGVPVTLVATPTAGIAPFTFKWSDGLVQTGSSAVSRVVEPAVTTSYSVIIIDSKGCQSDPSNTLTVSQVTRSSLSQALQAKYCVAG